MKFNHIESAKILNELGFRAVSPNAKHSMFINDKYNIVAYYVAGYVTPMKKNGYLFIRNNARIYAYSNDEINCTVNNIINE